MRAFSRLFLSVMLLSAGAALEARAQGPDDPTIRYRAPAEYNAALRYWEAWGMFNRDLFDLVQEVDWSALGSQSTVQGLPGKLVEAFPLLERDQYVVDLLLHASSLPNCDFEIRYEQGINALLPHLGKGRASARLLRADARRLWVTGDTKAAAERLAAIYGCARHFRQDKVLISSLVSVALCSYAHAEVRAILDAGRMTDAARDVLLAALDRFPEHDPFGTRLAIAGGERAFARWVERAYTGPTAGEDLVNSGAMSGVEDPAAVEVIRALDGVGIALAVKMLDRFYPEVLGAWDAPDGEARLEAIHQRVREGEFGPLGVVFAPALAQAHRGDARAREDLASMRAALGAFTPPAPDAAPAGQPR